MELVVFLASLKFFFVEGGEQFLVGIQTSQKIGTRSTVRISLGGVSFGVALFFALYYFHALIPTNWLELVLAITLFFFAASMFKEVFEKNEQKELEQKSYKYGYITIVSLESIENAAVLAALTFIDISGAFAGAAISISVFVTCALFSKRLVAKIPLATLRLVSGCLLALTATPLLIYSIGTPTPDWLQWIIPRLK